MIDPEAKKTPRHRRPSRAAYMKRYVKERSKDQAFVEQRRKWFRDKQLREKYGITGAEYDVLLAAQGGVCAICQNPPAKRRLSVDHHHKTKQIRGLLCFRCNYYRVGHTQTVEIAKRLLRYLEDAECHATVNNAKTDQSILSENDHSTLKVRGLLCHRCNSAMGGIDYFIRTGKYSTLPDYIRRGEGPIKC